MIREITLSISEVLFWILGGVPIVNTFWIIPYVVVLTSMIILPFFFVFFKTKLYNFGPIIFILTFFPLLLFGIGPPIVQAQMLQECKTVEIENTIVKWEGKMVDLGPFTVDRCRYKENFYAEFGEWKTVGEAR